MGDVVLDPHGEMVFGSQGAHVVVHSLDHGRGKFLGTQAVTTAGDLGTLAVFHKRGDHVKVQGIAHGSRLLGSVKYGDTLDSGGESGPEGG